MELAKDFIDVGLFTNRVAEMRSFYGEQLRLPHEETVSIGAGVRQYRYALFGSVLNLNHARDPLPARTPGGYRRLTIADPRTPMPFVFTDPDGNDVRVVPTGHYGINQTGIHLGVTDEEEFERFYKEVLGCERLSPGRYQVGKTILSFESDPDARRVALEPPREGLEAAVKAMWAVGIRYFTVQVRDCDVEYKRLVSNGAREGTRPVTVDGVGRIAFIRDPDGNWIEISQRTSPTGPSE